jgi:hypothetical protein
MRLWVDIHNLNDKRYLLKVYDESVDESLLIEAYDKIAAEDQKLSGSEVFDEHYHNIDKKLWEGYNINIIYLTKQCLEMGRKDLAKTLIDDFRLKIKLDEKKIIDRKAIYQLERLMKSINNRVKMRELREGDNKKPDITYESMQVNIQSVLEILPDYNCSVALFREYEKSAKRRIELQKAQ